jgi:hypothetical protein
LRHVAGFAAGCCRRVARADAIVGFRVAEPKLPRVFASQGSACQRRSLCELLRHECFRNLSPSRINVVISAPGRSLERLKILQARIA